jgi:uncharacterized membrane protein
VGSSWVGTIHLVVEWAALGIELVAVAVIIGGVVILSIKRGTLNYLTHSGPPTAYESYKHQLGKALLLGLELHCRGCDPDRGA